MCEPNEEQVQHQPVIIALDCVLQDALDVIVAVGKLTGSRQETITVSRIAKYSDKKKTNKIEQC